MKITIEVTDFEFKNNKIRISDLLYTGRLSLVNVPQHIRSGETWFYNECIHRAVHTKDLQLFLETLRIVKRDADELKGTDSGDNARYVWLNALSHPHFNDEPEYLEYLRKEGIIVDEKGKRFAEVQKSERDRST